MGIRSILAVSGVVKGIYPVGGNGLFWGCESVSRGAFLPVSQGRDGSRGCPSGRVGLSVVVAGSVAGECIHNNYICIT